MKIPQSYEKCYEKGAWVMESVMEINEKCYGNYEKSYENCYGKSYEKWDVNWTIFIIQTQN